LGAQLPELRDLDLSGWDCLFKLEGAAKRRRVLKIKDLGTE
jgi:hypothetical protein